MESWFGIATLWFGLALLATFLATRLRVSIALMELGVGVAAAFVVGRIWGPDAIGADVPWLRFLAPFLGCAAAARWLLGWDPQASWLAGIVLSTASMAVVYAVMLETGFNRTDFGKGILGACFVNDLGTVIALGLMFAPFTWRGASTGAGCTRSCVTGTTIILNGTRRNTPSRRRGGSSRSGSSRAR